MKAVIDLIIKSFNFEKVHKAMTLLNWKWASITPPAIPTINDLRATARLLLAEVSKCEPMSTVKTGGFEAKKYIGEENIHFYV